jgi:hypothetical protein
VLQELIRQAPAEYVTVGWLTSTLRRHSFGIIMLCLGLLATTPVGSTVPGLILAVIAVQLIVGRTEPVFPHFIMTRRLPTKQLLRLGGRAIHVLKYLEKVVHPRWPMTFEVAKRAVGVMVLLLTVVLLLTPVPLSNVAPAMVISLWFRDIWLAPLANPLPEDGEPPGPQGTKFETGWNLGSGTGVRWPCRTFQLTRSYVSARARQ